jgi:signal transduction histidine kinase
MTFRRWWLLAQAAWLTLAVTCWGQPRASNWRGYTQVDGLPESGCISLTYSPRNKVLVRHANSPIVSELDGYDVRRLPAFEPEKSRIYQSPGGQLWTVVSEGLREFRAGVWVDHPVPDVAAELRLGSSHLLDLVPLYPVRQGVVLVLLPSRLLQLNFEGQDNLRTIVLRRASETHLQSFTGMAPARDGGLWVSGKTGIAKMVSPIRYAKPGAEWREYGLPSTLQAQDLRDPHEDLDGGLTVTADSTAARGKLVVYFDAQKHWTAQPASIDRLRQAWRGPDGTHWEMSFSSLVRTEEEMREPAESDPLSARPYYDVAMEPSGAFWLATANGLFRYAPPLWRTPSTVRQITGPIRCLAEDPEGRLWFIGGTTLHALQDGRLEEYAIPNAARSGLQVRTMFALKNSRIVVAGETGAESEAVDELFSLQPQQGGGWAEPAADPGPRVRALGLLRNGNLCLQDVAGSDAAARNTPLLEFDGQKYRALTLLPTPPYLGPRLYSVFATQEGDLWLSGDLGTARYRGTNWVSFIAPDRTMPEAAISFVQLPEGRIWCAARDQIWEFDGSSWSVVRTDVDGISGMVCSRHEGSSFGSIWVASNSGLLRYCRGTWIENGPEEGLPSAGIRGICEDSRGVLWSATTRGLSLFRPDADPDPPRAWVQELPQARNRVPEGTVVIVSFGGQDKWKYSDSSRLLFSYRLDQHDWFPFQAGSKASFADLQVGKHVFQVRAMDRNGNISGLGPKDFKPLEFWVSQPWYKETRLVLIAFAGLGMALFFAGIAFNRHLQLVRSYAEVERKVAERTRQLEVANRQLLHSQKMNALGTLAAGLAHDFNNILSIIKGSAQIIEDNLDNPDKIRTRADRIRIVVEQGAGIVKAMLGFSRESSPEPVLGDLNSIVEETLKLLGDRFLREVQVGFQPGTGLPPVLVARDFVQQILLNFIFNAAEAMSSSKRIVLATRSLEAPPSELVLSPLPTRAYVAVSVQDFGCGIPPQNLSRVFEPFFTTKSLSAHRGTGLGLSMAYELARKLGAGLAVESAVDQGSTFTLILPVRDLQPHAANRKEEEK